MNLTWLFVIALAFGFTGAVLDWSKSASYLKKYGKLGEKNPWMRVLMGISPWLGLAWKLWPPALTAWAGLVHTRDVQNFGVPFGDAPTHKDYYAVVWILLAIAAGAVGLFGFIRSKPPADVTKPPVTGVKK